MEDLFPWRFLTHVWSVGPGSWQKPKFLTIWTSSATWVCSQGSRHLVQDFKGKRRWNHNVYYNLGLNTLCCHFHIVLIIQLREGCIVCEYQEVKFTGPLLEIWHAQEWTKLAIFEKYIYNVYNFSANSIIESELKDQMYPAIWSSWAMNLSHFFLSHPK